LSPNPVSSGILNISGLAEENGFKIIVVDMQGNHLDRYNNVTLNENYLNFSGVANGIYQVILFNDKTIFSQKVVVQN